VPAFKLNLKIDQGGTFAKSVTWKTGAPPRPVDLTGCKARMQVRETLESPLVLLELTSEGGRIVLGGEEGTVAMLVDPITTAAIAWESGVYDLEVIFPDGSIRRLLAGSVSVSPEVTR
jgi:hypothetical protein